MTVGQSTGAHYYFQGRIYPRPTLNDEDDKAANNGSGSLHIISSIFVAISWEMKLYGAYKVAVHVHSHDYKKSNRVSCMCTDRRPKLIRRT